MFKIKQTVNTLKEWTIKNKVIAINFFICLIFLEIMLSYSSEQTFWYDEMITIAKAIMGFAFIIEQSLTIADNNSLPFYILACLWYKIMPYGAKYLLILTEIPIFISVFVLGLCGKKLATCGKLCPILACLFGATSARFIFGCGFEFRAYSYVVLFSTFAILFYIGCQKSLLKGGQSKNPIG